MSDLSVSEAARRLHVNEARVRALLGSGQLRGKRVGTVWVVDAASVEHRRNTASGVMGRPFSPRTAWTAGALLDGMATPWLTTSERSRLRSRLRKPAASDTKTFRRWLTSRGSLTRYKIAGSDIAELIARTDIVSGGISAASRYGLGLGHGSEAEIYTDPATAQDLRGEFFLIESADGNLGLRTVTDAWHRKTARPDNDHLVVPRLIVAADLLDSADTRSRSAGTRLLAKTLEGDPVAI